MSRDECRRPIHIFLLAVLIIASLVVVHGEESQENFYIVYMGDRPTGIFEPNSVLQIPILNILSQLKGSILAAEESIVHNYKLSFNGFVAKLSAFEAEMLLTFEDVLAVFPNRYYKLHTTRSWDFLGFPQTVRRNIKLERDVIVGLLDTGITPEAASFADKGLGPPPAKWKGTCGHYANFSGCNNKIIGARYFKLDGTHDPADILSPVDVQGHGTHTASTLAGNPVVGASLYGLAKGTARGAVPSARIAVYKVCWTSNGCSDMDILAAFDAAIEDGVDVISISIGGYVENYLTDSISIGSFHAMKKGILTTASAGNGGPLPGSVVNGAPWLLTVAASGMDRTFRNRVQLGNGRTLFGTGLNTFDPKARSYPLVNGANIASSSRGDVKDNARYCLSNSLNPIKVKGRLVYCVNGWEGPDSVIKGIGGIGTILESDIPMEEPQIFVAPATVVNGTIGKSITDYISRTRSPTAVIYKSQEFKIPAPYIALFSSRGPHPRSSHLFKPDVAAPGVDILAAYTPLKPLTNLKGDNLFSKFTIISGTSMACPHVGGVAAYVKSFHPNWSPAAIKSAIMTTATPMSPRVNNDAEFAYGAGQVNPIRAVDPGLVFDMTQVSYIEFLCKEGFKGSFMAAIVGSKSVNCSKFSSSLDDPLNYPSMQLKLRSRQPMTGVFARSVTNVGPPRSIYNATITAPAGVGITVYPRTLSFYRSLRIRSFKVVVKVKSMTNTQMLSASLIWRSFAHKVRIPIVIYQP